MRVLHIKELTIDSAQYIPHYPGSCVALHGHTYFIRNIYLYVKEGAFVDFRAIKNTFKDYDHVMFVPEEYVQIWEETRPILARAGCHLIIKPIKTSTTDTLKGGLCEEIAEQIATELLQKNPSIHRVRFGIYEGPNQGVIVEAYKGSDGEVIFK